jgi:hypothetical protein
LTLSNSPAAPLSIWYARQKMRKGKQPIRDWNNTGRTRASMDVLAVGDNTVTVGFTDAVAARRAATNNARQAQFGVGQSDRPSISAAIADSRPIQAKVVR